jgi:hypothetical protein
MSALAKINARVKALKKKHPGAKHVTLQKQAGREYKAGKLGGVKKKKKVGSSGKKKAHARKTHKRRVGSLRGKSHQDGIDRKRVDITIGSVATHKAAIKRKLISEIGIAEGQKLTASSARTRKKIQKRITAKKAEFRKYC